MTVASPSVARTPFAFCALLGAALVTACGGATDPAPRDPYDPVIALDREAVVGGDTVVATVTAAPRPGSRVAYIRLLVHGLVASEDSLGFTADGPQSLSRRIVVPLEPASGTLVFEATAGDGVDANHATVSASVRDDAAPMLTVAHVAMNASGDSIVASVEATDNAAVLGLVVRFRGAFTATDSVGRVLARAVKRRVARAIPAGTDFSRPLDVEVDVFDHAGRHTRATTRLSLSDVAPPDVRSAVLGWRGTPTTNPGEAAFPVGAEVRVRLEAIDNARLTWVGYRLGAGTGIRDSVPAAAATLVDTLRVPLPAGWRGTVPVTFFARDAAGLLRETSGGTISLYEEVARPTRTAELRGAVSDLVHDARRQVAYLAQPDSGRILVLSTATMTYGPPIVLAGRPVSIDLTPGGDSLLVALRATTTVGVVHLADPARTVTTVPLALTNTFPTMNRGPGWVRTTAGGLAIVAITFNGSGFGGQIFEIDLATGTARQRTDAGAATDGTRLVASADRSHLLQTESGCCGVPTRVYTTATNTFGPHRGTIDTYGPHLSSDRRGDRYLIASGLYDGALEHLATFAPPHFDLARGKVSGTTPTAIAPSGEVGYVSVADHFFTIRLADGGVLAKTYLPAPPTRLLLIDDGAALLSVSATRVAVVDLR